jgi:hypothetical protein
MNQSECEAIPVRPIVIEQILSVEIFYVYIRLFLVLIGKVYEVFEIEIQLFAENQFELSCSNFVHIEDIVV